MLCKIESPLFILPPPLHVHGSISPGVPFPALILGSWPDITHSHEILPLLTEGKAWQFPFMECSCATKMLRPGHRQGVLSFLSKIGGLGPQLLFPVMAGQPGEQCNLCGEEERAQAVDSN